ncbi:MAG TPA: UPF0182 family protein [Candidatus Binataceae bacterium]|nr:UPF0182 family protein [Candidatus Binataceae bacterium]
MRPRILLLILAAVLIAAFLVLSFADGLIVDLMWFTALGYRSIYTITFFAGLVIFAVVFTVSFIALAVSGLIALGSSRERERLRVVRRPEQMAEVNLPEIIRALGDRVPWKWLVLAAALGLSLFVGYGEASNWPVYLKAFYAVPFGIKEPAFDRDVGFYVFTMPLLEELRDLFLIILILATVVAGAVYWIRGSLDFRESPPQVSPPCAAHLSALLGFFFVQRAFSYWIARYALTLHSDGVVFGLRYVDHILWQPGLWLLVVLALFAAAVCFANVRERGLRLPVAAAALLFAPAIVLSLLQPVIERLWVKPDELRVEQPYLERNIEMTRRAYQLDGVDVKPFAGLGQLTPASLTEDSATIKNIRLWDPRPLIATYKQLQEIRLYYDFHGVDIDRYWINGEYTEMMLSGRELDPDLLPAEAQTWVNRHLKFTHGYGLVMSPVNVKDREGLPILAIKNIPPASTTGFDVTQPRIYYGEETNSYVVVKGETPEFDYPRGNDNVYDFYKGSGGVPISGLLHRILLSFYFRDINLLVTGNIGPGSEIMLRRNISERVAYVAPFLNQDSDPYLVVHDGGLYWILDCYTTSDHYPYSQTNGNQINYIRNSVKAVINAYDGATDFYVSNPEDPIIRTWERIYPGTFKAMSDMPPDLHAHIRYPEDFFLIQADIYRTYHMTDPTVFYNKEDLWSFPRENYSDETMQMQPYYVIMRLPGEATDEYVLMLPMVPQGRDNMISWLAARCDGADYGHLFEFAFSKDRLFYGPYQIQALINQNPEISQQYSLWNQMGSKVILGNLLVFPIEDSLLYVEPLYIRAADGQLPELKRVIAAYGGRTVMGVDLPSTLASLFKGYEGVTAPAAAAAEASAHANPSSSVPATLAPGAAAADYRAALEALRSGDWTGFGGAMQKLGQALGQPGGSPSP